MEKSYKTTLRRGSKRIKLRRGHCGGHIWLACKDGNLGKFEFLIPTKIRLCLIEGRDSSRIGLAKIGDANELLGLFS